MSFVKCVMRRIHHYNIIQDTVTALRFPCPSPPSTSNHHSLLLSLSFWLFLSSTYLLLNSMHQKPLNIMQLFLTANQSVPNSSAYRAEHTTLRPAESHRSRQAFFSLPVFLSFPDPSSTSSWPTKRGS